MPYHHYSFAFTSNSQGGGSRLLWFLLGGLAATVWIKVRERRNLSGHKEPRALLAPGTVSSHDAARLRERLAQMNVETTEAALDVADATLDAAMKIVGALKQTLGEQRAEAEQPRGQTRLSRHMPSGPSVRSPSPSLVASFHHVEGTS